MFKEEMFEAQNGKCADCGNEMILPWPAQGVTVPDNQAEMDRTRGLLVCRKCRQEHMRLPADSDRRPRQPATMATDLDAPYVTTADGRNPWPQIWAEQIVAGSIRGMPTECEQAAREWAARELQAGRGGAALPAGEIW